MTPYVDAARYVAADTCQLAVVFIATLVLVDVSATLVWICLHRSVGPCLKLIETLVLFTVTRAYLVHVNRGVYPYLLMATNAP